MKTIFIAVICLFSSCVFSADWSESDKQREIAYMALHFIDLGQTLYIAKHPGGGYTEANPLLHFKQPGFEHKEVSPGVFTHSYHGYEEENTRRAYRYFLVTGVGHYLIADALSPDYRKYFQYVTIGVESAVVGHNYSVGVRVDF